MKDFVTIDLHVHSTASDGTFSPQQVIDAAKDFAIFSLTDHDNCDGYSQCMGKLGNFISGIELSVDSGVGFDKFHLLAFGMDVSDREFNNFLNRIRIGRYERNMEILSNFSRIGIEIPSEELISYAGGDVLGRPHIARWLIDHRYVSSLPEAFEKYLLPTSPEETRCYANRYRPSQEESFGVIHRAGGICVMAHPRAWRRSWLAAGVDYKAAEKGLAQLKEMGLDGLEALYQANTQEENVEFVRLAEKLSLIKTAGSDFHGANKPTINLGMSVSKSYIAPFLERLNRM